jgi:creatinine amidohydrolase
VSIDLSELTTGDVAAKIAAGTTAFIPFGSIEQHGPHLPCGTDSFAAADIALELARIMDGLFVPFAPYGFTPLHQGRPGTVSLRRSTLEALVDDVCSELVAMGLRRIVFVNWHEGNSASLNAVATDLQERTDARFYVAQACYVAQRIYAERGGQLTHGGGIETLAVMAHDASLVHTDRAGAGRRATMSEDVDAMRRSREVYGFVTDVSEIAEEGWYGDPSWAQSQDTSSFAREIADAIARDLAAIEKLQPDHD